MSRVQSRAPPELRVRPVRPRAPCPVAPRVLLRACWAPATSSFGNPTLIGAIIPIELPSSASYLPHWHRICRSVRGIRGPPSPPQPAPASSRPLKTQLFYRQVHPWETEDA